MTNRDTEVAIIGGGAAGISAGRRLVEARVNCLIVEVGRRLGGRAWTTGVGSALALDLGCGWLHSADRNPWRAISQGLAALRDDDPPYVGLGSMLLKKSFCIGDRNFFWLYARFSCKNVGDLIV